MSSTAIEIRPYEVEDRDQVRQISYDTGLMGKSIEGQWRDQASWEDLITGYYLDKEPENASVAVMGQRVVGYLLGCQDTAKRPDPGLNATLLAIKRGLFLRPGTAGMIWRTIGDGVKDTVTGAVNLGDLRVSDDRWPAHLHINLAEEARGQGVGSRLIQNWVDKLKLLNVSGCHLETLTEDGTSPSISFFESNGFEKFGALNLVPGMRSENGNRIHAQVMVRELS